MAVGRIDEVIDNPLETPTNSDNANKGMRKVAMTAGKSTKDVADGIAADHAPPDVSGGLIEIRGHGTDHNGDDGHRANDGAEIGRVQSKQKESAEQGKHLVSDGSHTIIFNFQFSNNGSITNFQNVYTCFNKFILFTDYCNTDSYLKIDFCKLKI